MTRWAAGLASRAAVTLEHLREQLGGLSGAAMVTAGTVLAHSRDLMDRLAMPPPPGPALHTRLHGHFDLGQVLITGSDVLLTGFGSGTARAGEDWRAKGAVLKDVAGLLRSLDQPGTAPRNARVWTHEAALALENALPDGVVSMPTRRHGPGPHPSEPPAAPPSAPPPTVAAGCAPAPGALGWISDPPSAQRPGMHCTAAT